MKKYYTIGQAGMLIGVHADTIRRYERLNLIKPEVNERGWKEFSLEDLVSLCARVQQEYDKGKDYYDIVPEVKHKEFWCGTCGWEYEKAELIPLDPGYSDKLGCRRCGWKSVIHNTFVAGQENVS